MAMKLFGDSAGMAVPALRGHPKWSDWWARWIKERASYDRIVPAPRATWRHWRGLIRELAGQTARRQAETLHRELRAFGYHDDGAVDHWATPRDMLDKRTPGGDCEDHALVLGASLKELGWDGEHLILAIGKLPDGRDHAVLVLEIEGERWVADQWRDGLHHVVFRAFSGWSTTVAWDWANNAWSWAWADLPIETRKPQDAKGGERRA